MTKPNNKKFYYHYDAQGNVIGLTNKKGNLVGQYDYEAFGKVTERDGSFKGNTYRFSTKEHGAGNLYYYGYRYYDPQAGRWLTPDPLGRIDGPNLYAFVNNNPVNLVDPWGLCKDKPWWENLFPFTIISAIKIHPDTGKFGEEMLHIFKKGEWSFRFDKFGRLCEHWGKVIQEKPTGVAKKALEYLKGIKPNFFLKMPAIILIMPTEEIKPTDSEATKRWKLEFQQLSPSLYGKNGAI